MIHRAAQRVGDRRGLPPDWLNDGVKGFLPGPDRGATVLFDRPRLAVRIASPRLPVRHARLRRTVAMANKLYQAGSYSSAGELLPGAIADDQLAARELRGDDRQAAFRVLAETYHLTSRR